MDFFPMKHKGMSKKKLTSNPSPRDHAGGLVFSWCIFILITSLLGDTNAATAKNNSN
jgi:hypothetical protein